MGGEYCFGCMEMIDAYPCPHCGFQGTEEGLPYALLPGTILKGRYLVGKVLGQGGFGITYMGLDLQLHRKLAIKEYYPASYACRKDATGAVIWYSGRDAQEARVSGREMFLKEARKMSLVSHIPEVVQVYDMFQGNDTAYICMDFIEGVTLADHLNTEGPLNWPATQKIFLPVISAMEQVHKAGLVHRDLSPDNIMLRNDGSIRILDLGAAKDLNVNTGKSSMQVAKSGFSPPEQYMVSGNSGSWTDVYAMAATMYYTLTGNVPLPSMDRMNPEGDKLDWDLPRLQVLPNSARKALQHAMALKIADRTQTMEAFTKELTAAPDPEPKKKPRPRKMLIAAAALVLALLAGFLLIRPDASGETSLAAEGQPIWAKVTEDGRGYIPMPDGTIIEIDQKVTQAVITADRKHILGITHGSLYMTDSNQEGFTLLTGDCEAITEVRNDGVIYYSANGPSFRVPFAEPIAQHIGMYTDYLVAEDTISTLYQSDESGIYTLDPNDKEGNRVGTFESSFFLDAISNDGKLAVYNYGKDGTERLMLCDSGEKVELASEQWWSSHTEFTEDSGLGVILFADKLWFKTPGKAAVEVQLNSDSWCIPVFTDDGPLSEALAKDVKSVYVSTEGEEGCNMIYVSLNGNCKQLLSGVEEYCIRNGMIVYRDTERNLRLANLKQGALSNDQLIAEDVNAFELTDNGRYIYYMRECQDMKGEFYCCTADSNQPVKIASDVFCETVGEMTTMYTDYSPDGSSVLFYKDGECVSGISKWKADLRQWNYGDDGSDPLYNGVVVDSIIRSDAEDSICWYLAYKYTDDNSNVYGDLMLHYGDSYKLFASDVAF